MMTLALAPAALAEIIDVHPDAIRDLRCHRLVDQFGTQGANGRWLYSIRDAVALWAGWSLITEARIDRARALRIAYAIAPDLIAAVRGASGARFHASVYDTAAGGVRGWSSWKGDLADLAGLVVDNLVDVAAVAAIVPPELRAAIIAEEDRH
jgi:hypothetical protein